MGEDRQPGIGMILVFLGAMAGAGWMLNLSYWLIHRAICFHGFDVSYIFARVIGTMPLWVPGLIVIIGGIKQIHKILRSREEYRPEDNGGGM